MAVEARGAIAVSLLITPSILVAVQMRATGAGTEVVLRGATETPPGTVEGALIQNPVRLAQAIRTLFRDLKLRARSVTVVLPSSDYFLRTLRLPEAPLQERRGMVRGELEQMAAVSIRGGGVDYIWVSAPTSGPSLPAEVSAYYTPDTVVDSIRETLHRAGLKLTSIEPASLALMRAYLAKQVNRQPLVLLYIAAGHSDLCLHDGLSIRHMRRIPAGWSEMPKPLTLVREPDPIETYPPATAHSLSEGEQESVGLKMTEGGSETPVESEDNFLSSEVKRTLAFLAREHRDKAPPEAIIVLGPTSAVKSLSDVLSRTQLLPVVPADVLNAFTPPETIAAQRADVDAAEYSAAIGAGLGNLGLESGIPLVNIAHQEEAARIRQRAPGALLAGMTGSTIWMVAAAAAAIVLSFLQSGAERQIGSVNTEIAKVQEEQAPLLRYQEATAATNQAQALVQIPAASVLGRVAASAGPGISLNQLVVARDGKLTISGKAMTVEELQRFTSTVGTGRSVRMPVIESMRKEPKGGMQFTVTAKFPKAPPEKKPVDNESGGTGKGL